MPTASVPARVSGSSGFCDPVDQGLNESGNGDVGIAGSAENADTSFPPGHKPELSSASSSRMSAKKRFHLKSNGNLYPERQSQFNKVKHIGLVAHV